MVPFILTLNGILKKTKLSWYGPLFLLIIILIVRTLRFITTDPHILYFANTIFLTLGLTISFTLIIVFIQNVFSEGDDFKYEVIFYKNLGMSIFMQFILKLMLIFLAIVVLYSLCSILMWNINLRYFVLAISFSIFFLFLRILAISLELKLIYYTGVILIGITLFYPLYILPNIAYVVNGEIKKVIPYALIYVLLYLAISFKLFIVSWRRECIGWLS